MGKRQIAAIQTRKNVIAAAEKLIAEKGFENVTINDIITEAGVAVGTFYTYFKRKEDVVGEIALSNFIQIQQKTMGLDLEVSERIGSFLTEAMRYIVGTGLKITQQWIKNVVEPPEEGMFLTLAMVFVFTGCGNSQNSSETTRQAVKEGEVKTIGLSNFPDELLKQTIETMEIKPQVVQMEARP